MCGTVDIQSGSCSMTSQFPWNVERFARTRNRTRPMHGSPARMPTSFSMRFVPNVYGYAKVQQIRWIRDSHRPIDGIPRIHAGDAGLLDWRMPGTSTFVVCSCAAPGAFASGRAASTEACGFIVGNRAGCCKPVSETWCHNWRFRASASTLRCDAFFGSRLERRERMGTANSRLLGKS